MTAPGVNYAARPAGKPAGPVPPPRPPAKPTQAPPGNAPNIRGRWFANGDNWVLMHATGKNQWVKGGVKGHPTPARPNRPTPLPKDPMAQLTPQQVRRTASNTISAAYNPQYTDLNSQAGNAKAVYAKQQSDDKYFQNWLAQQGQQLQAHADASNKTLSDFIAGVRTQQQQSFGGQAGSLIGAADARAGNVTNNAQQAPFEGQLANAQTNQEGSFGNAAAQAMNVGNLAGNSVTATIAGNEGRVEAARGVQAANLTTTLKGIAQQRTKLNAARTGDIAKEIARLQGVEIQKSQYKTSEAALEEKLKIQGATAANLATTRSQNAASNAVRAAAATTSANAAATNAGTRQGQLTLAQQKDATQRANHTGPYAPAGARKGFPYGKTATGTAALSPASQNAMYSQINGMVQALKADINKYHNGIVNSRTLSYAYHDLLSGRAKGVGFRGAAANTNAFLNAALNSLQGGLNQGDLNTLAGLGLTNPGKHLRVGNGLGGAGAAVGQAPLINGTQPVF